jgi:hypothetical protein
VVYFGAVPTVWYILELFQQCGILWSFSNSVVYFGAVPTVWYFLELFHQCGYHTVGTTPKNTSWNSSKKYHTVGTAIKNTTVGTAPNNTTLLEQLQKIPHYWSCSNSVVFFGAVPTVWYFLELFQLVWYILELFQPQKIPHCWNSSKKYHTCWNSSKKYHTVGTAPNNTS